MSVANLIIVCCHGIWLGGPANGHDESEWLIAAFQKSETPTFIEHIKAELEAVSRAPSSLLVFSGGPTRKETRLSEAASYLNLAIANGYFNIPVPHSQIALEERALDSYQNVIFSLTLFYAKYLRWPERVTIVSHAFKKPRLVDGHCAAIGFPLGRVDFVGIDPESMIKGKNEAALEGVKTAIGDWESDPHGRGAKLKGKREGRNSWGVWQGLFEEGFENGRESGLVTVGVGEQETLVDDAPRPWM